LLLYSTFSCCFALCTSSRTDYTTLKNILILR
jgi:hypothetical protein